MSFQCEVIVDSAISLKNLKNFIFAFQILFVYVSFYNVVAKADIVWFSSSILRKISKTVYTCAYIKFFLKEYCSGLVEGVDLIFRIVCQISGQDNVRYKIQKPYRHFQIKKFCSCQSKRLLSKYLF